MLDHFRAYFCTSADGLDVRQVLSVECYLGFCAFYPRRSAHRPMDFQRVLGEHVRGIRAPFTAEEETALLALLRQFKAWPCFRAMGGKMGTGGARYRGFHEMENERWDEVIALLKD